MPGFINNFCAFFKAPKPPFVPLFNKKPQEKAETPTTDECNELLKNFEKLYPEQDANFIKEFSLLNKSKVQKTTFKKEIQELTNHNELLANRLANFNGAKHFEYSSRETDKMFSEYQNSNVVYIWHPYHDFCLRFDKNAQTVTVFNSSSSAAKYHTGVEVVDKDAISGGLQYKKLIKAYITYQLPKNSPVTEKEMFESLKYAFENHTDRFYENIVPFCGLVEVKENDQQSHPERYIVGSFFSGHSATILYHLQGLFHSPKGKEVEATRVFNTAVYRFMLNNALKDAQKDCDEKDLLSTQMDEVEQRFIKVIGIAKKVLEDNSISKDEFKALYATLLDIQNRKKLFKEKLRVKLCEQQTVELKTNCLDNGLEIELPRMPEDVLSGPMVKEEKTATKSEAKLTHSSLKTPLDLHLDIMKTREFTGPFIVEAQKDLEEFCELAKPTHEMFTIANRVTCHVKDNPSIEKNEAAVYKLKSYLERLFLALPDFSGEEYNALSAEEIKNTICELEKLSSQLHAFASIRYYDVPLTERLFVFNFLHFQILAGIENLAKRNPETQLGDVTISSYPLFAALRSHRLVIGSAEFQHKLLALARHFDPSYSFHQKTEACSDTELKNAILNSAFSLVSLREKRIWNKYSFNPFMWDPARPSTWEEKNLDIEGQTYAYYKKFITHPKVLEAWKALGEKAPEKEVEKVLWIVENVINDTKILPKELTAIQNVVLRCQMLAAGNVPDIEVPTEPQATLVECSAGKILTDTFKTLRVRISKFFKSPEECTLDQEKKYIAERNQSLSYIGEFVSHHKYTEINKKKAKEEGEEEPPLELPLYSGTQNQIYALTWKEDKEWKQIQANPIDSVNRLIGYYQKRLDLLDKKEHRDFIYLALFQFQRLEVQVLMQPLFINRLKDFFEESIYYGLAVQNYKMVSELCLTANKIALYLNHINVEGKPDFPDIHKLLLEDILPQCKSPTEYFWLHNAILGLDTVDHNLKVVSAAVLLFTKDYIDIGNLDGKFDAEELYNMVQEGLKKDADDSVKKAIVSSVAQALKLAVDADSEVTLTDGIIKSGSYNLDIFSGKVTNDKGDICTCIPASIFNSWSFFKTFGVKIERILPDNYEKNYSVTYDEFINTYHLIPRTENAFPTYHITPNATGDGIARLERTAEGKTEILLTSEQTEALTGGSFYRIFEKVIKKSKQNKNESFYADKYAYWLTNDSSKPIITATAPKEENIIIECEPKAEDNSLTVKNIRRNELYLCDKTQVPESTVQYFKQFGAKATHYWRDSEHRLRKIELVDTDMGFIIGDDGKIYSDRHHGFYISQANIPSSLRLNDAILNLTNGKDHKQLILNTYVGEVSSVKEWVEADYINDKWEPCNLFSRLSLMYHYLSIGNVEEAVELLNGMQITSLTVREKDLLQTILIKENCPLIIDLKLRLLKYKIDFSDEDRQLLEDAYFKYLLGKENYLSFQLPPEEERTLLGILIYRAQKDVESTYSNIFQRVTNIWKRYDLNKKIELFKDRLNVLEGKSDVHFSIKKVPPSYQKKVLNNLTNKSLQTTLEFLETDLEKAAKEYNRQLALYPASNASKTEEEKFNIYLKSLFEITLPIDKTTPPDNIGSKFFHYYKFIVEDATKQQRADFAKSLDLVPMDNPTPELVHVLKSLCKYPYGKTPLYLIISRYRDYKAASQKYANSQDVGSLLKGVAAFYYWGYFNLTLSNISRFFWVDLTWSHLTQKVNNIFTFVSIWWNSTSKSKKITASVTPWKRPFHLDKEKPFQMHLIDESCSKGIQEFYNKYFKPDEELKVRAINRENPIPMPEGDTPLEKRQRQAKKELDEFFELTPDSKIPELKSIDDLPQMISELEAQQKKDAENFKIEFQMLLHAANTVQGDDFVSATMHNVQRKHLGAKELSNLFATATEEQFMERTTFKDTAEFRKFLVSLTAYYTRYSRYQQLLRVTKELKKAAAVKNVDKDAFRMAEREIYIQEAAKILQAEPAYIRSTRRQDRILLAHEVTLGYLAREDQVDQVEIVMENWTKNRELLMEAPFGWGKSEFFQRLMNALLANGKNLVYNLLPSMQEKDLVRQLEKSMDLAFGMKVNHIEINRDTVFTAEQLSYIYRRMEEEIKLGNMEAMRPETYQSLLANALLHCYETRAIDPKYLSSETLEITKWYLKIIATAKTNGVAIAEEVDKIFSNINRLIIALDETRSYSPRYARLVREIIDCIVNNDELNSLFQLTQNNQESVTDKEILDRAGPILVDHFIQKYQIREEDKVHFKNFVLSTTDEKDFEASFKWAEKQEDRDRYALLKGMINICLKQACKGKINAMNGYGLSKLFPNFKVPIPYLAKMKPKETERGQTQYHPDIAILRAYFYYLAKGLTNKDITDLIKNLKKSAENEALGRPIDTTTAALDLAAMIKAVGLPEGEDASEYKLSQIKGRKLRVLIDRFKDQPQVINYFVQHVVSPQIDICTKTIEINAQHLRSAFKDLLGASATPQDPEALGPNITFLPKRGTAGSITHILLSNTNENGKARLNVLQETEVKDILEESGQHAADNNCDGIVESASTFSEITNEEAVKIYAEKLKPLGKYQGILFCDESDKHYKVYDFNTGKITLLQGYEEDELFKLYSEADAFNTNWKSPVTAYFKIMLGAKSTWEDVGQAAGRARFTHLLQTIGYEIQQANLKAFDNKNELSPLEMLTFLLNNSTIKNAMNNFIGLNDQLCNEQHEFLINAMCGLGSNRSAWEKNILKDPDPQLAHKIFNANESTFITENLSDPWAMYAKMKRGKSAAEQLKQQMDSCVRKAGKMKKVGFIDKLRLKKTLKGYEKKWQGKDAINLPSEVDGFTNSLNSQVEVIRHTDRIREYKGEAPEIYTPTLYQPDIYPENFDLFQKERWWMPSFWRHTADKVLSVALEIFPKMWEKLNAAIPVTYLGSVGSLITGVLLVDIAETVAARVVIAGFAIFFGNIIGWLATGYATLAASLSSIVVKNFKVKHDTHYLQDIVNHDLRGPVRRAARMFKNNNVNVLITNDKIKHWPGDNTDKSQKPFKPDAKPLLQVAVIVERTTDKHGEVKEALTLIDLDMNSSLRFKASLLEDKLKTTKDEAAKRNRWIAIYDVEAEDVESYEERFVAAGANGFDAQKWLTNPLFHAAIAQIKLYNGYTKFRHEELEAVPKLVDKIGTGTINKNKIAEEFFYGKVLRNKREERQRYATLPIAAVLNPSAAFP